MNEVLKELDEWEKKHPALSEQIKEIREIFTDLDDLITLFRLIREKRERLKKDGIEIKVFRNGKELG